MTPRSTRPIVWRLRLRTPAAQVFAAWLDPAQHTRFWCERSTRTDTGFRLEFIDGTVEECLFDYVDIPRRLGFQYFGAAVSVELHTVDGATDLQLTVVDVPAEDWTEVYAGWLNVLLPFKAHIDHGVDLRNHDRRRTWSQRSVDQ